MDGTTDLALALRLDRQCFGDRSFPDLSPKLQGDDVHFGFQLSHRCAGEALVRLRSTDRDAIFRLRSFEGRRRYDGSADLYL